MNERCDYWWRSELDGGSGRMFDGGEKGKAQTAGEVDRGCLSGAVGLLVMPTLQPRTLPSDLRT